MAKTEISQKVVVTDNDGAYVEYYDEQVYETEADNIANASEDERVRMLYREADKIDKLSKQQLIKLVDQFHGKDKYLAEQASHVLTMSVTKWVINLCMTKYKTTYKEHKLDLVMAGLQGVATGLQLYDPRREAVLTTFIYPYIIHDLQEYTVKNQKDTTPYYAATTKKILKIIDDKKKRGINDWTMDDIAIETGLPKSTIRECLSRTKYEIKQSINDDESALAETLPSNSPTPEEQYIIDERAAMIQDAIDNGLSNDTERTVIRMTYGFETGYPLTDKEISIRLGIPESSVRTIKNGALARVGLYYKAKNGLNKSSRVLRQQSKGRNNISITETWQVSQETMARDNDDLGSLSDDDFNSLFL